MENNNWLEEAKNGKERFLIVIGNHIVEKQNNMKKAYKRMCEIGIKEKLKPCEIEIYIVKSIMLKIFNNEVKYEK